MVEERSRTFVAECFRPDVEGPDLVAPDRQTRKVAASLEPRHGVRRHRSIRCAPARSTRAGSSS